jgi:membrane associated rhomboid family serine protease
MCAMPYQEKEYKRRLSLGQRSNALITLIAINLSMFVIFGFAKALYILRYEDLKLATLHFNKDILSWVALSANSDILAKRPWTLLTHFFVDDNIWRIIGNMLWLWVFGYILQDLTGNRKIFPVYLYSAFFGGIAFILAVNFLPNLQQYLPTAMMLGASAGIMGIAVAATTLSPGFRVFPMLNGGIPVWIITAIYLIIDIVTSPNNPGENIAHLAGVASGFFFIFSFRKGLDWGGWMNNFYDWWNDLFNPDKPKKGKNTKKELFYKSERKPYHKTPNVTSQRVDEILDKINQHGYNSLTDEEKELLKKASREDF